MELYHCARMSSVTLVCVVLMVVYTMPVYSGSIQKRAANDNSEGEITRLFDDIGGRKRVDLILVMDRSQSMSKQTFYLSQKKLAQAILKQYASLVTSYVRLAVITFAKDVTVVIDAISNPDNAPNKCSLFHGEDNLWDTDVVYTQNETNIKGTNLKDAFLSAREIFIRGEEQRSDTSKIVLVLTDGKYNVDYDPINEANELKDGKGAVIYGVGMGTWLEIGNVRLVTSKYNDEHLYASFASWETAAMRQSSSLVSYDNNTPQEWIRMISCSDTCMDNSDCYCDLDRGTSSCRCRSGFEMNTTTSICQECPQNTYKSSHGNEECTPCPPGSITDTPGAVDLGTCYCSDPAVCGDPCDALTCNEHQECVALDMTTAECVCLDDWEGENCSTNHDSCMDFSDVCQHSSKCVDGMGRDVFTCVCTSWGYAGEFCEINQNECTPDMCINDGQCTDRVNDFLCMCGPDWHGRYCQDKTVPTTSTTTTTTTTQKPTTHARPTTAAPSTKDTNKWIIIGACVGGGVLIIIIIVLVACCVCRKRKEKNEEEVKHVAQQFSGFWKRKTVRGSKYVKEMEEDSKGGLPSAPSGHRPDLIENTANAYASTEHLKTDEYAEIPYETVTLKTGMESWQNYITELEVSKVIERALIVKLTGDKKATTSAWMYDPGEQSRVTTMMDQQDENVPLLLQDGEYHIQENDGTLAVGRTIGSSQEPKTLAIGKTKTYLIMAIALAETDGGKTKREVQWIVDHISGEGY